MFSPRTASGLASLQTHLGEEVKEGDVVAIYSRTTKTWQPGIAMRLTNNMVEVKYKVEDDNGLVVVGKSVPPCWDGLVCKPTPLRMQLLRLRAQINRPVIICILGGSGSFFDYYETRSFVKAVSEAITADDVSRRAFVIGQESGGGPGVQSVFFEHAKKSSHGQIFNLIPVGKNILCDYNHGVDICAGSDWAERNVLLGSVGDIYITFSGDKIVAKVATIAHVRGAIVAPIIQTSGASSGMHDFPKKCLECPDFVDSKLWRNLSLTSKTPSEVAVAVNQIILQIEEYKKEFLIFGGNLDCVPATANEYTTLPWHD